MKMNKAQVLGALLLTGGLATLGISAAHAANNTRTNPMGDLVNTVAKRFNLNATDLQQTFDAQRVVMQTQRQQEQEQRLADRLTQAIKDGKLTQAQADLITAKHKEFVSLHTSLQNKTQAEVQTAMKAKIDELKKWATDNNIPAEFIPFGFGGYGQMHNGSGRGFGPKHLNPAN